MNQITIKSTKTLAWGIGFIALALLILMIFSIERTAWLISIFESGSSGHVFGLAAAIIIEIAAISFIVAEILINKKSPLRKFVTTGLVLIVTLQFMANGIKGWINGWQGMIGLFGAENRIALSIAGLTWFIVNGLIPLLIFILSKLLASFIQQLMGMLDTSAIKAAADAVLKAAGDLLTQQVDDLKTTIVSLKATIDGLKATATRRTVQRKRTARRLAALRSERRAFSINFMKMTDIVTQTAKALERAEAELIAIKAQPKGAAMTLESVAQWIIDSPQATIATLAIAVRAQVKTDEAARLAFAVSGPTLTSWIKKAQPETIEIETQKMIEV